MSRDAFSNIFSVTSWSISASNTSFQILHSLKKRFEIHFWIQLKQVPMPCSGHFQCQKGFKLHASEFPVEQRLTASCIDATTLSNSDYLRSSISVFMNFFSLSSIYIDAHTARGRLLLTVEHTWWGGGRQCPYHQRRHRSGQHIVYKQWHVQAAFQCSTNSQL